MSALFAAFWPYIAAAIAGLAAIGGAYFKGRADRGAKEAAKDAKAAAKSTKDMNNVDTLGNADDAARIDRLRRFERDNRP